MKLHLSPDGPDGNGPAASPPQPPSPGPDPAAPPPPPAAAAVISAGEQRLADLQAELAAEKRSHAATAADKRERETRISELEDERRAINARLAEIEASLRGKPAKAAKKPRGLRAWLTGEGWDQEEA